MSGKCMWLAMCALTRGRLWQYGDAWRGGAQWGCGARRALLFGSWALGLLFGACGSRGALSLYIFGADAHTGALSLVAA